MGAVEALVAAMAVADLPGASVAAVPPSRAAIWDAWAGPGPLASTPCLAPRSPVPHRAPGVVRALTGMWRGTAFTIAFRIARSSLLAATVVTTTTPAIPFGMAIAGSIPAIMDTDPAK